VEDQKKKKDKYTYDNKGYVNKVIDILEEEIKGKEEIAKVVDYLIKRNGKKYSQNPEKGL